MHPLLVDRAGVWQVCGRDGCADVGMMGAGQSPEKRLAVAKNRNAEREVGVVSGARVRAVVEEGIALLDVIEKLGDRPGGEVESGDVNRDPFFDGSNVKRPQDMSRAFLITAERLAFITVLVISRMMASKRLASTDMRNGSMRCGISDVAIITPARHANSRFSASMEVRLIAVVFGANRSSAPDTR
jgi:hypothetical protein